MLKPLGPYVVPARRRRELTHVPYFARSVCFACRRTVDYLHCIVICEDRAALICDACDTKGEIREAFAAHAR